MRGAPLATSPPLAGLSLPERLTIPSASPLIYHPNGGYERGRKKETKKTQQFAEGDAAAEGQGKCLDWNLLIKFKPADGFIYAALVEYDMHIHPTCRKSPNAFSAQASFSYDWVQTELWCCKQSNTCCFVYSVQKTLRSIDGWLVSDQQLVFIFFCIFPSLLTTRSRRGDKV